MRAVDKRAFGERVQKRRETLGLTQTDLATKVGMKQQGVDAIEHGVVERPRLMREIAAALRTTEQWLLWEEGPADQPEAAAAVVSVMGLIGAGGAIDTAADSGNLYEIEVSFPLPAGAFALQVSGESMFPRYDPGDIIICEHQAEPDRLIGREAAVQTIEGSRYLKRRLLKGARKGLYDLESFNAPLMRGLRLQWAAPVHSVVRFGRWRRIDRSR